jgi:hypothetical protein
LQLPGSRQWLWWRRFCAKAKVMIGFGWEIFPDAFDLLLSWGQIPVSSTL